MALKVMLILFVSFLNLFSQSEMDPEDGGLEDPDENQYLEMILERIFQPFDLETADSTSLGDHGYTPDAVSFILGWQKHSSDKQNSSKQLLRKLDPQDATLFRKDRDIKTSLRASQIRQRLEFSPSMEGWRVLNKGRLSTSWGSINMLLEQDPGEKHLTDHAVFTLSSHSLPFLDNLILGDFHIKWGGGLIADQQGSRSSLIPGSLIYANRMRIRPHYSSREQDYFRGIASTFSQGDLKAAAFVSSREVKGRATINGFREDSDGIHPYGAILDTRRINAGGLAVEFKLSGTLLYGATLVTPQGDTPVESEFGFSKSFKNAHSIQVFANSMQAKHNRMCFSWSYSEKSLILAIKYRYYSTYSVSTHGYPSSLLGAGGRNESGLSVRAQIRPSQGVLIRYALKTGHRVHLISSEDLRTIQHHKIQVRQKVDRGYWQFDFSRKLEAPMVIGNIWDAKFSSIQTKKGGFALQRHFSKNAKYTLNLKSAWSGSKPGWLIQQRITGTLTNWKWTMGYVNYLIPDYTLRLSVYESGVAESFSFYTCFDNGDRWFIYLKHHIPNWIDMELKVAHSHSFDDAASSKLLAVSLQLSVVL